MPAGWTGVVGVEVHAQLAAARKLFSGAISAAAAGLHAGPNAHVARFDAAIPGTLPVLQRECVERTVVLGLALGGRVHLRSAFDRKHYFYADLPAGYQITQHRQPIVTGGAVHLDASDGLAAPCVVRLVQLQLEQDTGKSVVDEVQGMTLVDLNRAGSALVEIVSEPDMRTSAEAAAYVRKLQSILRAVGASQANMEDGTMRCDVNVSVRRDDPAAPLGTRIELKNLNSVRSLAQAIDFEIDLQVRTLETGGQVVQETKSFDVASGTTFKLRDKEQARDYRYMPEPDIPDIVLDAAWVEALRKSMPELPHDLLQRLSRQYGLPTQRAKLLADERGGAEYFERVMEHVAPSDARAAQLAFSWVTSELLGLLNARGLRLDASPVTPAQLGSIVQAVHNSVLSGKQGKQVLVIMADGGGQTATQIAAERGLALLSDEGELAAVTDALVAEHQEKVAAIRGGKDRLFGWFVAQALKRTGNRAPPDVLAKLLRQRMGLPPM